MQNFESKTYLFLFQFQHQNPSSQNMSGPEASTNVTVQLEVNYCREMRWKNSTSLGNLVTFRKGKVI